MSFNFGSTVTNDFSTFSDDEKLNYALKLALNRVQTWGKTPWYEEPSVLTSTLPNLTLKNKIPPGSEIETYYLVDPDLGKATDRNVLKAIGSNDYNTLTINTIDGSTYASNPPIRSKNGTETISVTNNGETKTLLKGISKTMIAKYVYWQNKLTGKVTKSDGTGTTTTTTSGTGTYPDDTAPFASFMTLSNVQNDYYVNDRRVSTMKEGGSYSTLYDTLESYYSGLEIIHWSNIDADGTAPPSKRHPFFKVFIGLPTYSTYSDALKTNFNNIGVSSSQSGDNIGFTNKLLEGAMGSINGYKFYLSTWNKKTQQFKQKKEDTYGDANNLNILYFLSYSGFILNYGEKNILDGKGTSIDDTSISIKYPPTISFVKYTGETFSDGIISQGDTLPAVEVSNDKDLFINTSDNTIHRLEDNNGTKTWIGIGGSGGGSSDGGSGDSGGSSGVPMEGQVLDKIIGVADGRSVLGATGSFTMPNITSFVDIGLTHSQNVVIEGSKINYKPPSGTKDIIYKFFCHFCPENGSDNSSSTYEFYVGLLIDNVEITSKSASYFEYAPIRGGTLDYKAVISIGDVEDIANGKFSSWTTEKEIKLIIHCRQQDYGVLLYTTNATIVNGVYKRDTNPVLPPTIEITSVGTSSGTSSGGDVSGSGSGGSSGGSTITRKGQVLEVLLGRAESGESVEVESGTYNFPAPESDPTSDGTIGTTQIKIDSSELTYNAPEGTERIFYEYRIRGGYGSNEGALLYYHLHINDEPFGNEERIQAYQQRNIGLIQSIITKSDLESNGFDINSSLKIYYKMRTNTGTLTLLNSGGNKTRLDDYIKVTAIGEQTSSGGGGSSSSGGDSEITIGTNMVTKYFSNPQEVTIPNTLPGYHVSELDLIITPKYNDSIIEIKFNLFGEMDENSCFRIKRNDDFVINTTSNKENALSIPSYDQNHTTTPQMTHVRWYDTPNTTGSITYKLYISRASATATYTNYINRSGETQHSYSEFGISTACAIEHPKPRTITVGGGGGGSTVTKKGQTLETLIGVFDGRTVEVESGTYTLKNVTQTLDYDNKAWLDLPNTDIDYKPPAGTKQVYIRYTVGIDDVGYRKRPSWRLAIDGEIYEEQAMIEQLDNNDENYASETKNRSFVLHINGTNDIANGFLESWDTLKKIQLQVASRGGRQIYNITRTYSEATGNTGTKLLKPSIKIVAIGESTITTGGGGSTSTGGGSATNVKYKMIKDYKRYENVPNIVYSDIPKDNYSDALNIPELDISITPNLNNSLINVRWVINFESEHNTTFKVVRFIGSDGYVIANNSTAEESGVATSSYDNNNGHTPHQLTLEVFDEPKVTSEVIYKIYIVGAANDNNTRWFALNGSGAQDNDTGTNYNFDEKLISSVFAIEYDQHNVGGGGSTGGSSSLWNVSASNDSISYSNGNVGIGTNDPQAGLHVTTVAPTYLNSGINDDTVTFLSDWTTAITTFDFNSSSSSNHIVSIIGKGLIYGQSYVGASDQRIKKNIFEVDDDKALQKLRDISCCWYNYIDHLKRGKQRTIGFIAQQVKEQLPEAVQTLQDFIPNKMKFITDASWNNTTMLSNELLDVSGIKYKFYVSNDLSGNDKEIDLIGQNDNSFVFDQSYNYIFCYGKEVDDFHTLDKQKLFTLNFSATQEIDRLQQQQLIDISQNKINIETLKIENADLKNQINIVKQENEELKTELNIIKLQNQTLQDRLEAIEKRLYDANI